MCDSGEDVSSQLYRICYDVIEEKTTAADAVEKMQTMMGSCPSIPSLLLDTLFVVEVACQAKEAAGCQQAKTHFTELLQSISDKIIPRDVLAMELECLEANSQANKQQLVRLKTRLYFKQSKFNLLREESEGYAKLITELLDGSSVPVQAMMTRVLCLIGQFNLDPNRVTDVVLDCFECCPDQKDFFVSLLKEIKANRDYLCTLLGFKFSFYKGSNKSTPFSLYVLTASLLDADLVDLLKITAYMQPNADEIKQSHKDRAANASLRMKKAETIMASQIAIDANAASRNAVVAESVEGGQTFVGVPFSAVAAVQEADDEKLIGNLSEEIVLASNQKLGVVCALLELGSWTVAKQLIDRLPEFYALQASPRMSRALADLIDDAFDSFYKKKCPSRLTISTANHKEKKACKGLSPVTNWDELAALSSVLGYLGPRLVYRTRTATKLTRLLTVFYQEKAKQDSPELEHLSCLFMVMVDEVLVPGLSLQPGSPNAAFSEELWQLLQLFPYAWRYRLYGRWKTVHTVRHPEISIARGKVFGRTKYVLKRLSKDTVKVMGRQLGKLCHVHPITVFDYLLSQVQSFDNLIQPVVESIKFLTNLEFDILSYCIIEQLASPDKIQLKATDGTLSPWLQALSTLVGAIYKKYNVELAGILNYVANQLKNEKSFDLLILREIIQSMSSIESSFGATDDQLDALQGGEVLRLEAGGFSNVRNKRASNRLRDALLEGDLFVGLTILIAQQRECIVYRESEQLPLKLAGEMVDQCRDTLMQFCGFLLSAVKSEEYSRRMPPAHTLVAEYNLPLDTAMYLTRATHMPKVIAAYDASKKTRKLLEADGKTKLDTQQKFLFFKSSLDKVVDDLIASLGPCIPPYVCSDIPIRLLVVFWVLSLYDIEVPTAAYDKAVEAVRKQARDAADNPEMSKSKRAKEEERLKGVENRLREEERKQLEHVERVRMWLSQGKAELFENGRQHQTFAFLQMCILPRAFFSELDAIYCARLVMFLHQQRTTYFQTLIFLDKTFNDLLPLLSGLSENEAASFGRFLDSILGLTNRWRSDKQIFDKECAGFPGFITRMTKPGTGEAIDSEIAFGSFQTLCCKWQQHSLKAFKTILENENGTSSYALLRNTLVVMTKMSSSFPMVKEHHDVLTLIVQHIKDTEKGKRDDLSLKAASYAGRLRLNASRCIARSMFAPGAAKSTSMPPPKANGNASVTKERPRKSVSTPESKKRLSVKTEKKEPSRDKEAVEEKGEKAETEEGEVPPSPPPKKVRNAKVADEDAPSSAAVVNSKDKENVGSRVASRDRERGGDRNKKERRRESEKQPVAVTPTREKEEKREKEERREKDEKREKEDKRDKEEKKDERKDKEEKRHRAEKPLDEEFAGPAPPPPVDSKRERNEEKDVKRVDSKTLKRSARTEPESNVKVARKERTPLDSRVTRPVHSDKDKRRSSSREMDRKEKRSTKERESSRSSSRR